MATGLLNNITIERFICPFLQPNERANITIVGDPIKERYAVVRDTPGQGTNFGIGCDEAIPLENNIKVGSTIVPPRVYVDDKLLLNADTKTARENGNHITKAFELLALKANTSKSVVFVCGGKKEVAKKIKDELTSDLVKLHSEGLKCVESEPYLGVPVHEEGFVMSINKLVKDRVNSAWSRVTGIMLL